MIVCDTGPLVAAALATDDDYHACVELFTGMHLAGRALLVPATVVATLDRRHFTVVRPSRVEALVLLP